MKQKFIITLVTAVLFNALAGSVIASVTGFSPGAVLAVLSLTALIPLAPRGALREGLNKEIWIPEIIEKFYPDTGFMKEAKDLSVWVDNGKLNLQEAGIDPKVLIDNDVWPIPVYRREDIPHEIVLKRFDTENTVHINAIEVEESSGKRASVTEGHRKSLATKFGIMGAHNFAPLENGDFTPVLTTTGSANRFGFKSCTFSDLMDLELQYDLLDVEGERVLVIDPRMAMDLKKEDMKLYKAIWTDGRFSKFKIYSFTKTPRYNRVTGKKVGFNDAASATDSPSSFSFLSSAVCRAASDFDMYYSLKDPHYRGDVIGFNMRGIAMPITGKYIGAVYYDK